VSDAFFGRFPVLLVLSIPLLVVLVSVPPYHHLPAMADGEEVLPPRVPPGMSCVVLHVFFGFRTFAVLLLSSSRLCQI
jgi:hypothetical protein